jgi:polysaccharide pyruvyl transferase WcaK-like protein
VQDTAAFLMVRIIISGWYGWGNTGDDAMLQVLLSGLTERLPDVSFIVLSENPAAVVELFGYRFPVTSRSHLSPYGPLKACDWNRLKDTLRVWREVASADMFIIGGGSLIRDGNWSNFLRLMDDLAVALAAGVPTAAIGLTVGPLRTRLGRWVSQSLLGRTAVLGVRDAASRKVLLRIGIRPEKILDMGDLALLLRPPMAPRRHHRPRVAICPCTAMLSGLNDGPRGNAQLIDILGELCGQLVRELGVQIDLIPFRRGAADDDDVLIAERIKFRAGDVGDAVEVSDADSVEEVLNAIGQASLVVGARLHSLIFALLHGIPVIGISYGQKVRRLLDDIDLGQFVVEPADASTADLLALCRLVLVSNWTLGRDARIRIREKSTQAASILDHVARIASERR